MLLPSRFAKRAQQYTVGAPLLSRQATALVGPGRRFGARNHYNHHMALDPRNGSVFIQSDFAGHHNRKTVGKAWLRDNCRCEKCVNQDTMQRNYDIFRAPVDLQIQSISQNEEAVEVLWTDSHRSHHPWSWLNASLQGSRINDAEQGEAQRNLWDSTIGLTAPEVPYDKVVNESDTAGMAELTSKIHSYGFCFVTGTPKTPEASKFLLERIGPIRNTHYGGFYDFIPDLSSADTAYTNLALDAHTDTTYFTEPAGLQAFHMLSHTPPAGQSSSGGSLGGQSLLVDGFNVAKKLKDKSPAEYEYLSRSRIPWHASGNQGVAIAPDTAYPVIEEVNGQLQRVRWNNDDRGSLPDIGSDKWYEAAREWVSLIRNPSNEYWFQLEPGRMLIFDNWRVLHGRSAFQGLRRICGAYISRDDFISRWKTTNFPREEVIAANMNLK